MAFWKASFTHAHCGQERSKSNWSLTSNTGCPKSWGHPGLAFSFPFCSPKVTTFMQQGLLKARCLQPPLVQIPTPDFRQTYLAEPRMAQVLLSDGTPQKKHGLANSSEKQETATEKLIGRGTRGHSWFPTIPLNSFFNTGQFQNILLQYSLNSLQEVNNTSGSFEKNLHTY